MEAAPFRSPFLLGEPYLVNRMQDQNGKSREVSLLDRAEEILISVFLGLSTLLVFFQVIARYVFNTGITWAPELVEHMFLWTVMIGASYGVKHGVHLGVDIMVAKFKSDLHRWAILFSIAVSVTFTAGMTYLSYFYVLENYRMELLTVDLQIPQWIPNLALPFGFGLITIRFLTPQLKITMT